GRRHTSGGRSPLTSRLAGTDIHEDRPASVGLDNAGGHHRLADLVAAVALAATPAESMGAARHRASHDLRQQMEARAPGRRPGALPGPTAARTGRLHQLLRA